ncbi:sulfatase-like hydrolase/transferase [Novosphingobium pentaromativorans]|uniref:Arylsulfatase n=1 Tax=Novosphingobium pentaromativorans US6-1 TaxID=1088721 RepID=G6EGK8_9SPHN|nr:sulfatase-like hydrolase/transferase [Novosphingobium pentaromativorans]EHJ59555.1 arylsulfatase [Novosphingobium pentaromativorans US6-1]
MMDRLNRREAVARLGLLLGASTLSSACASLPLAAGAKRPNIVLVVLDDTGFSDFGCFGAEIRTPAIDALAASGLRYSHFDTRAICSPTRAALLSGRNSHTMNMLDLTAGGKTPRANVPGVLRQNARLLPAVLKDAGYVTLGVGKWHLSPAWEDGAPGNNANWPLQRGFDQFYGFIGGWQDQYRPELIDGNRNIGKPDDPGYHFSSAIVDEAIARIDKLDAKDPFFLYLAFGATHSPVQVREEWIDRYAGVYERGWDAIREERLARQKRMGLVPPETELPPHDPRDRQWSSLSDNERQVYARFMATYAGFLEHADAQLGRLVEDLKQRGEYENTLFVVLSDNGPSSEGGETGSFGRLYPPEPADPDALIDRMPAIGREQIAMQVPWTIASATPYRRYKSWPYLGGVRAPLIVSWAAGNLEAGAIRHQAVDDIDIAPTLAQLAGASFAVPDGEAVQIPLAGRTITATMASASAPSPRPVQYFELRGNRAIRAGHWRAVAVHRLGTPFETDEWRLFDMDNDPNESRDLSATNPEKLAELKALWESEARRYGVTLTEGPDYMRQYDVYADEFDTGRETNNKETKQ